MWCNERTLIHGDTLNLCAYVFVITDTMAYARPITFGDPNAPDDYMDTIPAQDSLEREAREGTPLLDEPMGPATTPSVQAATDRAPSRSRRHRSSSRRRSRSQPSQPKEQHHCAAPGCKATAPSMMSLTRHWVTTHELEHRRFCCTKCGYRSHHIGSVEQHLVRDHGLGEREAKMLAQPRKLPVAEGAPLNYKDPQGVRAPRDPQWFYENEGLLFPEEWIELTTAGLQRSLTSCKQELESCRQEIAAGAAQAERRTEEEQEVRRLRADEQDHLGQIYALNGQMTTLRGELASKDEQLARKEAELSVKVQMITLKDAEISAKEQELVSRGQTLASEEAENMRLKGKIAQLESVVAAHKAEIQRIGQWHQQAPIPDLGAAATTPAEAAGTRPIMPLCTHRARVHELH